MGNPDLDRQPFNHKGPFDITRNFRLNGKDYKVGDVLDPKRVAVDHRKFRQLYDARHLNMAGDPTSPKAAVVEDVKTAEPVTTGLVAGEGEFVFDPAIHAVEKSGTEDWIADEEALLVRITTKAATALKKAKKPTLVVAGDIIEWPEADEPELPLGDEGQDDPEGDDEAEGEDD